MINPATKRSAQGTDAVAAPRAGSPRPAATWLVWAVPTATAAALGLYHINVPMLWRDEFATWSAASRTLPQLWTMVHHVDAVLSVYYFGLHLWMGIFGASATAMRLPSVIAMTGAAAVVALTGKRLGGVGAGLAGGMIFALVPSVSRYAQEARPYAFAEFFAALATLLLLRAVERPHWHRWGAYALALAATGAANLVALCVLTGHVVIVLAACRQSTAGAFGGTAAGKRTTAILAGFCSSAIAGVVLDTPILIEGHKQSLSQIGRQPAPSVAALLGASSGPSGSGSSGALWPELFCSTLVAIAVIVLAVASVAVTSRRVTAGCALACAVLPIAVVWLVSQGSASYWIFRYLLFTVSAWTLSAGIGVDGIGQRLQRLRPAGFRQQERAAGFRQQERPAGFRQQERTAWVSTALRPRYAVTAGLVIVVGLLGAHDQRAIRQTEAHNKWAYPIAMPNGQLVDYRAAAAVIAAHQRPGDGIVFQVSDHNHYQVNTSVAYYLRGKPSPKPVFQTRTQAQAGGLEPVECAQPTRCLAGTPRLWVVYVNRLPQGTFRTPFAAIPAAEATALRGAGYRTQALYKEAGITVALLVPGN